MLGGGYAGSLYPGVQQQMIAISPEFSPVLAPTTSSSSSSWNDESSAALVDAVKSEEVCDCVSCIAVLVVFTVRRYALRGLSYRNSVCPSVRLSHSCTVSTRFDLRS